MYGLKDKEKHFKSKEKTPKQTDGWLTGSNKRNLQIMDYC